MSYKVSAKDLGRITLNERDTVASVLQNIAIILKTRQQSVPLYRDFGIPMEFIDRPIPVAKPLLISEITEAISNYEPRATVIGITFQEDAATPGKLIPTVEVEITDE
ncbi:MAG TPA: GPW/gp25 family protein [Clostridia bacterium]|nr:GPW/gp25 family protein [Clostridia bacterium]